MGWRAACEAATEAARADLACEGEKKNIEACVGDDGSLRGVPGAPWSGYK